VILCNTDYSREKQTTECRTEETATVVGELCEAKHRAQRKDAHNTSTTGSGREPEIG
jgi:hypothetical protein